MCLFIYSLLLSLSINASFINLPLNYEQYSATILLLSPPQKLF
ncbi:hypothetical protein HMPREF3203_00197 [Proteus mirabilis]|nr:hypothetical protein HMPREF3203_00197 [Proteus mirabilis]